MCAENDEIVTPIFSCMICKLNSGSGERTDYDINIESLQRDNKLMDVVIYVSF